MDRSASSLGETAGNIFYVFLPEMKKASQHQQVVPNRLANRSFATIKTGNDHFK